MIGLTKDVFDILKKIVMPSPAAENPMALVPLNSGYNSGYSQASGIGTTTVVTNLPNLGAPLYGGGGGISNPVHLHTLGGGGTGGAGTLTTASLSMPMPMPIGIFHTIAFTDANGTVWAMTVDASYVHIMNQISAMHNSNSHARQAGYVSGYTPTPPPPLSKMVDGEFSFDEMAEAEQLISELEGASNTPGLEISNHAS